jgi:exosome complex component RRP4
MDEMKKLIKKERDFVSPGDKIVESMEFLPGRNCFRDGDNIIAKRIGLVAVSGRVLSVIPLNGIYMPAREDMVIGEITDIQGNGWVVNIKCPYQAYLPLSGVNGYVDPNKNDMSKIYGLGDIIYGKINMVGSNMSVHVSMRDRICRKFSGGRVIQVNPAKVPRIIGKRGSMIDMIKNKTGSRVVVGQNGTIWLEGEKEAFVIDVIRMIEENSHVDGLTDKVEKILERGVLK